VIQLARLATVFVAAFAWSTVAVLLGGWAGLVPSDDAVSAAPADIADDPCALRGSLPPGTEARCEFPLARKGKRPLSVELRQSWQETTPPTLIQDLWVRDPATGAIAMTVEWRGAGVYPAGRILRLTPLPGPEGTESLLWMVGNCGGMACGVNDLTVASWDGSREERLLLRRFGSTAEIQLEGGGLTVFDGAGRGVGAGFSPRMSRRFALVSGVYVQLSTEPVPTLPPP
jgi:hypothetical protein